MDCEKYKVESRVECDGYTGTLKYYGPVGDSRGLWLGVDWDDPARGKHNGIYKGIRYFKAWHQTSASFIRPGKATLGISCPEAIKARYGLVKDDLVGVDKDSLNSLQKEINAPFLELVGLSKVNKKQSKFDELEVVCIREQHISHTGKFGELKDLCPNIKELDISKNLINSWSIIESICFQLHFLSQLNVSENQLPTGNLSEFGDKFKSMKCLTMNKMNYNWEDIENCIIMFPSIQELFISFNIISIILEPQNKNWCQLRSLALEGNLIKSSNDILKLGLLPCLEYVNLNSNQIEKIYFPNINPSGKTEFFPALKRLHLCDNKISEWQSVSELEKITNLQELKFKGNPVVENESMENARELIIAKISNLKFLNGTEILRDERRGAEYDYLKLYLSKWQECIKDVKKKHQFDVEHPRFSILVTKYGISDIPLPKTKVKMMSNVINVEFISLDDPIKPTVIKRKLLKNIEVQKIIGLTQRLFKTGGKIPTLSFKQKNLSKEVPLDKPLQELKYFSIQDGDQIMVRW
ncbi:tubulin-specific chaperone E [Prorops nasuta]|uniref:tubulin-specific chaperone E n=1 Tax=Prorops nasuta TaxID=863751 RepID=UPI0034CD8370